MTFVIYSLGISIITFIVLFLLIKTLLVLQKERVSTGHLFLITISIYLLIGVGNFLKWGGLDTLFYPYTGWVNLLFWPVEISFGALSLIGLENH